jgi:hypothetical protein
MMLTIALHVGLALQTAPSDTVPARAVLDEVYDLIQVGVISIPSDTFITVMYPRRVATRRLNGFHDEAGFALMWLIEGNPVYDKTALEREFGRDTARLHRGLSDRLAADARFSTAFLRLTTPYLANRGVIVRNSPSAAVSLRPTIARTTAYAMASRFIHVSLDGGRWGVTMCAKPEQLVDFPVDRDDAREAWIYSIVRGTQDSPDDLLAFAKSKLDRLRQANPHVTDPAALMTMLWKELEADATFRRTVDAGIAHTTDWSPVIVDR